LSELLERTGRKTLQADLPAVRLLFELLGFLLIALFLLIKRHFLGN
jgi:hypothetical protein